MIYTVFNPSKRIQARQIVDGMSGITPREQKNIKKLANASDKALRDFLSNKAKQKVEGDIWNKLLKLLHSEKKNLETDNGNDALIRDIVSALHKIEKVVGVQVYPSIGSNDWSESTTTDGPDTETTNGPNNEKIPSYWVNDF